MEQSPSWEADRSSATLEIPRILWNAKVHYRIHNSPSPEPDWSSLYPPPPSNLSKIQEMLHWVWKLILFFLKNVSCHFKGCIENCLHRRRCKTPRAVTSSV